jgi:hypothetical protein
VHATAMLSGEDSVRRRRDRGVGGCATGKVGGCSTPSVSRSSSHHPGSSRSSGRGREHRATTVCRRRWQTAYAIVSGREPLERLRALRRLPVASTCRHHRERIARLRSASRSLPSRRTRWTRGRGPDEPPRPAGTPCGWGGIAAGSPRREMTVFLSAVGLESGFVIGR